MGVRPPGGRKRKLFQAAPGVCQGWCLACARDYIATADSQQGGLPGKKRGGGGGGGSSLPGRPWSGGALLYSWLAIKDAPNAVLD